MFKIEDETTESALCLGTVAAVIWGLGLTWYAFHQGPMDIPWTQWALQLLGGILACLVVPVLWVRSTAWLTARLKPARPVGVERG